MNNMNLFIGFFVILRSIFYYGAKNNLSMTVLSTQ